MFTYFVVDFCRFVESERNFLLIIKMHDYSQTELIAINVHYAVATVDTVDNFSNDRICGGLPRVGDSLLVLRGGRGCRHRFDVFCRPEDRREVVFIFISYTNYHT